MRELTNQQVRYCELKATGKLNQREISTMLDIHYNTATNWNRMPEIQAGIQHELDVIRENNQVGLQRLMNTMIGKSLEILNDESTPASVKVQIIGQLFTQTGKMSGLEQPKKVQKEVTVTKGLESIVDMEAVNAVDAELA